MTALARAARVLPLVPVRLRPAIGALRDSERAEALIAAGVLIDSLEHETEAVQITVAFAIVRRFSGENWIRETVQALAEIRDPLLFALLVDAATSRNVRRAELGTVVAVLAGPAHTPHVADDLVALLIERASLGEVDKRSVARLVRAVEGRRGHLLDARLRRSTVACWSEMADSEARQAAWTLRGGGA